MAVRAVRGLEVNWDRSLVHVFRSDLKAWAPHHCFLPVSAAFGNIVTDPLGPFFVCPHVLRISRGVPRVFLIRHRFCHHTTGQFFCASFTWVVLECWLGSFSSVPHIWQSLCIPQLRAEALWKPAVFYGLFCQAEFVAKASDRGLCKSEGRSVSCPQSTGMLFSSQSLSATDRIRLGPI